MAEQGEECRYCERFVAVADHGEVNRFLIEIDAEPCDEGVNWNHEEDSDNMSLLDGFAVMRGMAHNQEKRDPYSYEREHAANNLAELVERNAAIPQVCLFNGLLFQCRVTHWPAHFSAR